MLKKLFTFIKNNLLLLIIIIAGVSVNLPAINGQFLSWDDDIQITKNTLVTDFKLSAIPKIFQSYCAGMYQPLATLSFGLEYKFGQGSPLVHHLDSLILHGLNIFLVYYLSLLLFRKKNIALASAGLFAIWPTQIETVSWISARSTLLASVFSLASLIYYLKYLRQQANKYYIFAVLLFVASLLSKISSAGLPLLWFLIDYLEGRKISLKLFLEKIPLLVLSAGAAQIAVLARKNVGTLIFSFYTPINKIGLILFSAGRQLIKTVWPFGAIAYYEHPVDHNDNLYWFAWLEALLPILTIIYGFIKRSNKLIIFCLGWFFINIALSIQLAPYITIAGADRYNYLAALGVWWLIIIFLDRQKLKIGKLYKIIFLIIFIIALFYESIDVSSSWKNNLNLWQRVLDYNPASGMALLNKAQAEYDQNDTFFAFEDVGLATALGSNLAEAWNLQGIILMTKFNRNFEALQSFNKAVIKSDKNYIYIFNRGLALANLKQYQAALNDFSTAKKLFGSKSQPSELSAICYSQGIAYYQLKSYALAIKSFRESINNNKENKDSWYYLGLSLNKLNSKTGCQEVIKAKELDFDVDEKIIKTICQ
ncbi:MAG: tetratricopeptide repeat protein [Patescibacteria group bacterium]|nr:tetratricopeptide repeat protein [Patescibacteria group bacterium]